MRWKMPEDWKNMMDFVDKLIKHANDHQTNYYDMGCIVSERISIIHFDHALELLMKSYLMRNEFIVYEIDTNKIKKGIKGDMPIKKMLKKDRTLNFNDIFTIFSKILELTPDEKQAIKKFHGLRNEIQHRALQLPTTDKGKEIEEFIPKFKIIYRKAFQNRAFPGNKR